MMVRIYRHVVVVVAKESIDTLQSRMVNNDNHPIPIPHVIQRVPTCTRFVRLVLPVSIDGKSK